MSGESAMSRRDELRPRGHRTYSVAPAAPARYNGLVIIEALRPHAPRRTAILRRTTTCLSIERRRRFPTTSAAARRLRGVGAPLGARHAMKRSAWACVGRRAARRMLGLSLLHVLGRACQPEPRLVLGLRPPRGPPPGARPHACCSRSSTWRASTGARCSMPGRGRRYRRAPRSSSSLGGRLAFTGRKQRARHRPARSRPCSTTWVDHAKDRAADYRLDGWDAPCRARQGRGVRRGAGDHEHGTARGVRGRGRRVHRRADPRPRGDQCGARHRPVGARAPIHEPTGDIAGYTESTSTDSWPTRRLAGRHRRRPRASQQGPRPLAEGDHAPPPARRAAGRPPHHHVQRRQQRADAEHQPRARVPLHRGAPDLPDPARVHRSADTGEAMITIEPFDACGQRRRASAAVRVRDRHRHRARARTTRRRRWTSRSIGYRERQSWTKTSAVARRATTARSSATPLLELCNTWRPTVTSRAGSTSPCAPTAGARASAPSCSVRSPRRRAADERTVLNARRTEEDMPGDAFLQGARHGEALPSSGVAAWSLADVDRPMLEDWVAQGQGTGRDYSLFGFDDVCPEDILETLRAHQRRDEHRAEGRPRHGGQPLDPGALPRGRSAVCAGRERTWTFLARHEPTGELAGFTELLWADWDGRRSCGRATPASTPRTATRASVGGSRRRCSSVLDEQPAGHPHRHLERGKQPAHARHQRRTGLLPVKHYGNWQISD